MERVTRPKRTTGPSIIKNDIERLESGPDTVTVACKLPNGLVLRLFDMVSHDEPVLGGGVKPVLSAMPRPDTVTINGNTAPATGLAVPITIIDSNRRGDGFGLTHNVDRDFFVEWLKQNKDAPYVREGLIWAYSDMGDVSAKAREQEKLKSGLEPLNPEGDDRTPRQVQPGTRTAA